MPTKIQVETVQHESSHAWETAETFADASAE